MSSKNIPVAVFSLVRIVATPNALSKISQEDIWTAIRRHQAGDWGDLDDHDRQENELSLKKSFRLLSAYHNAAGTKFILVPRHRGAAARRRQWRAGAPNLSAAPRSHAPP